MSLMIFSGVLFEINYMKWSNVFFFKDFDIECQTAIHKGFPNLYPCQKCMMVLISTNSPLII